MALSHHQGAGGPVARLTPREREGAGYILQGQANKVIAIDLGISLRTVEAHRARIFHKLGVRHAVELAHWFYAVAEPDAADAYGQRLRAALADQSQAGSLLPSNSSMGSRSG